MKFFVDANVNDGVYRTDVLDALDVLDTTIGSLETLCASPRKSEDNAQALEMILNTRRCCVDVLADPEYAHENADDVEQHFRL